jgi:hypothetical protein
MYLAAWHHRCFPITNLRSEAPPMASDKQDTSAKAKLG